MGHYVGPKARVNRRLGTAVYEQSGALRAFDRRDSPPGMHTRRGKSSEYARALTEKQKIKHYYGLSEAQLRRFLVDARRMGRNAGDELLKLCERRLDNVIRRAGLTRTTPQARQGVSHGHFLVNGKKATTPSMILRPGDQVQVRSRTALAELYRAMSSTQESRPADWLTVDLETLSFRLNRAPDRADVSLPVEVSLVIELLSR